MLLKLGLQLLKKQHLRSRSGHVQSATNPTRPRGTTATTVGQLSQSRSPNGFVTSVASPTKRRDISATTVDG